MFAITPFTKGNELIYAKINDLPEIIHYPMTKDLTWATIFKVINVILRIWSNIATKKFKWFDECIVVLKWFNSSFWKI